MPLILHPLRKLIVENPLRAHMLREVHGDVMNKLPAMISREGHRDTKAFL